MIIRAVGSDEGSRTGEACGVLEDVIMSRGMIILEFIRPTECVKT